MVIVDICLIKHNIDFTISRLTLISLSQTVSLSPSLLPLLLSLSPTLIAAATDHRFGL